VAVTFTGSSYLSVASVPASQNIKSSPLTFAMWVYPTTSGGTLIDAGGDAGLYLAIVGSGTSGSQFTDCVSISNAPSTGQWYLDLEQNSFGEEVPVQADATSVNAWVHYAATWNGTTGVVYKNGVVLTPFQSGSLTSTVAWNRIIVGGFNGDGQDAMIWNRVLTAAEIALVAKYRRPPVDTTSLVGHWPLRNGGNAGVDISGNGRNLTATGTVVDATSHGYPNVIWGGRTPNIILPPSTSTPVSVAGTMASGSALVGAVTTLVAGTLASGSALVGGAVQAQVLAGTLADGSALVGALQARVASSLASGSALVGAAVQTVGVAGTLASGSALVGSVTALVAGTLADSSALVGAVVQTQAFAGTLASGSALVGAAVQTVGVAGVAADSSALSGAVSVTLNVAGTLASGSALTGAIRQTQAFAGTLASGSALTGAAVQAQVLGGTLAVSSALVGAISGTGALSGTLADSSALVGNAVQTQRIAGTLADSSALTGTLQARVASVLADSSALVGTIQSLVSGAASSGSALAGAITLTQYVSGALQSGSGFTGTLTGGGSIVPYVSNGWFDGGDTNGLVSEPHTPWRDETTMTGTVQPHSPWIEA
jgi:hypothetical protein